MVWVNKERAMIHYLGGFSFQWLPGAIVILSQTMDHPAPVQYEQNTINTLWLWLTQPWYRWPIEIDDFPIKPTIYGGFSMDMLNNQMVWSIPQFGVIRSKQCAGERTRSDIIDKDVTSNSSYIHVTLSNRLTVGYWTLQ